MAAGRPGYAVAEEMGYLAALDTELTPELIDEGLNAAAFLREHPDVAQQILQGIQVQIGPDQVVTARLLPIVEEAEANGEPTSKEAKVSAAAAALAEVGASSEE